MPFKLPNSNPLESNPLFGASEPDAPENASEKRTERPQKKPRTLPAKSAGRPQSASESKSGASGYQRATFIVRSDLLKKLKDYAYTERREIKDVVNEILKEALGRIEDEYAERGERFMEK